MVKSGRFLTTVESKEISQWQFGLRVKSRILCTRHRLWLIELYSLSPRQIHITSLPSQLGTEKVILKVVILARLNVHKLYSSWSSLFRVSTLSGRHTALRYESLLAVLDFCCFFCLFKSAMFGMFNISFKLISCCVSRTFSYGSSCLWPSSAQITGMH